MGDIFASAPAGATARAAPAVNETEAIEKEERLLASLRQLDSLLIAFSGGADSAYLAWAAARVLGDRALAVTALSASYSAHDRSVAEAFVRNHGIRHESIETHETENPLYIANNADRCYYCKDELFIQLDALAGERRFAAVAYGVNSDDTHDFRPGHRAAFEHKVLAPLLERRPEQVRDSLSLPPRGPRDLGSPRFALPLFACALRHSSNARTARENRASRAIASRSRIQPVPRSRPRRHGAGRNRAG